MNIRRLTHLGLVILAMVSAGCATRRPEVSTWRDAQFSPTPTNTLALTERPNLSPQDAELGRMLVAEMQREGFHFVPVTQAEYLLTYVLDDEVERRVIVEDRPPQSMIPGRSPTPQTTEQIFISSMDTPRTYPTSTFIYHSKDIRLYLYTNPQTQPGRLRLVWQGSIAAGESVSAERELLLLQTLLSYFGKDQNGRVNLAQ